MRIIAGTYKGRILRAVYDKNLRPTADRVKETIFNILMNKIDFTGSTVLDMYAGSGNLGLEALSRGAERVVFVDQSYKAIQAIHRNIGMLKCESKCKVYELDVFRFFNIVQEQFNVIFADPPYNIQSLDEIVTKIFLFGLLRENGIAVIEHHADTRFNPNALFSIVTRREFGETAVTFLQHTKVEEL